MTLLSSSAVIGPAADEHVACSEGYEKEWRR